MIKIVNIDKESLHLCRKAWGISIIFSSVMIILKVIKYQGFTLSLENTVLVKLMGVQIDPARVKIKCVTEKLSYEMKR